MLSKKPTKKTDKSKKIKPVVAHDIASGWCCACDVDIIFLEDRIKKAYNKGFSDAKKQAIKILTPLCRK